MLCLRHLTENAVTKDPDLSKQKIATITNLIWDAARATTEPQFHLALQHIDEESKIIGLYLRGLDVQVRFEFVNWFKENLSTVHADVDHFR